MRNICKKLKVWTLLLFLALAAAGVTTQVTSTNVEAATKTGFQTINGKSYYIKSDGTKKKGWLTLSTGKYYFDPVTGEQKKGWMTLNGKKYYFTNSTVASKCTMAVGWREDKEGNRRYFTASGVMVTKWCTIDGNKYYFNPDTGIMRKGWLYEGKYKYYFNSKTGIMSSDVLLTDTKKKITRYFAASGRMATGWKTFSNGKKRYFDSSSTDSDKDGAMVIGFKTIDGKTYYFLSTDGTKVTGWITNKSTGAKYYLNPSNGGILVTSTEMTISGKTYVFDENGVATLKVASSGPSTTTSTGSKTIKNYLAGALQPVGKALYVWGGGWNDSTRKGISQTWVDWYNSQSSSYNYNNYRDLSTANRAKGLDCSGFVGWSAYQVMQSTSGVGSGYTVVSGQIGSYYKSLGWGSIVTQSMLSASDWTLKPGDIGYNDGHTWIVLGQCSDKSIVIVHSTPQAGCQISGTPTPTGDYSSEAIALAKKYMSQYSGYTKYNYNTSAGNYIRNGNYLRWNSSTLSDPDGYLNKTADEILLDLFGF
jgi:glucan-binding YG repeat protein